MARVLAAALCVPLLAACGAATESGERRTVTVDVGRSSEADAGGTRERRAADAPAPEVPGDAACDGSTVPPPENGVRDAEIVTRCLINAAREDQGLPALDFSEPLARAAATRSQDMAENDYFSHVSPSGADVRSAVERTGWIPSSRSWRLGENIGWGGTGRTSPADLMRGWLDSPSHRENIMDDTFTEVGVGIVTGAPQAETDGATYTTIFGVRGRAARG